MKVTPVKEKHITQVINLADKYKLNLPVEGNMMVAVNDDGNVRAFGLIRPILYIEPFVSENSPAAIKVLHALLHSAGKVKAGVVRCHVKPENKKLMEKLGFKEVFENQIIMEKGV